MKSFVNDKEVQEKFQSAAINFGKLVNQLGRISLPMSKLRCVKWYLSHHKLQVGCPNVKCKLTAIKTASLHMHPTLGNQPAIHCTWYSKSDSRNFMPIIS